MYMLEAKNKGAVEWRPVVAAHCAQRLVEKLREYQTRDGRKYDFRIVKIMWGKGGAYGISD